MAVTVTEYYYPEPAYEPSPGPAVYPHKCPVCNGYGMVISLGGTLCGSETSDAQTCPACNGHGTVSRPPHIAGDQKEFSTGNEVGPWECPCCKGAGVLWG